MDKEKKSGLVKCLWSCRMEAFGVALIVIATFLTIISLDSLGIVALFIVGAVLCCHQCFNRAGSCDSPQAAKDDRPPRRNPRPRNRPKPPAAKAAEDKKE